MDDLEPAIVNDMEFVFAKIESGSLPLVTNTSCPGKYFGRLTELANVVDNGIFIPQVEGKNLSTFKLELMLKLSLDLFEPNRR